MAEQFDLILNQPAFMSNFHDDRNRYLECRDNFRPLPPIEQVIDDEDEGFVDCKTHVWYESGLHPLVVNCLSQEKCINYIEDLIWHDECNRFCEINHINIWPEDLVSNMDSQMYKLLETMTDMIGPSCVSVCNRVCQGMYHSSLCKQNLKSLALSFRTGVDNLRFVQQANASFPIVDLIRKLLLNFNDTGLSRLFLLALWEM